MTGSGANPAAATDFVGGVLPAGTVNFAAGETSRTITVLVAADSGVEPDEGFTVTLSNPSNGTEIGGATAAGTILNDDAALAIVASAATQAEGQTGSTAYTFTVSRSGNTSQASTAGWAVTGSGANPAASTDFVGRRWPSGTVTLAVGETSRQIAVLVAADRSVEQDERFLVTLNAIRDDIRVTTPSAEGVILNDDPGSVIEELGATRLEQAEKTYFLRDATGDGPSLKYQGSNVFPGQFGLATPIGAEAVPGGYRVAWKVAGSDQYVVWNTDQSGNYISAATPVVPGADVRLQEQEPTFGQDLNGDGRIGALTTIIEAEGATSLAQVGSRFLLRDANGAGPTLKFQGSDVFPGQFGLATPIGAEAVPGGYRVAWKVAGSDQYVVWNTDQSGNYISAATPVVPGADVRLQEQEFTFGQDLNGDGRIGAPTTAIEAFGTTTLVQVGNLFVLRDGAGSPTTIKYRGDDVRSGQFGLAVPIAAEPVPGGYLIAWKVKGADQYVVWNTDSSGNFISSATPVISGSDSRLQEMEEKLGQDLNGDGQFGLTQILIENFGRTPLAQVGNRYFLRDLGGTGPALRYLGNDVTVGQFGLATPLGAEALATGYHVAWKVAGADQYIVWNTDLSGNYIGSVTSILNAADPTLHQQELFFSQDLNEDGFFGTPGSVYINNSNSETVVGTANSDIFYIGGGLDVILGGGGRDRFIFQMSSIGPASTNSITLQDFSRASGEQIDLSAIDAIAATLSDDPFSFIGTSTFSGVAGQLRWSEQGSNRLIEGDVNGDRLADLTINIFAAGSVDSNWFML